MEYFCDHFDPLTQQVTWLAFGKGVFRETWEGIHGIAPRTTRKYLKEVSEGANPSTAGISTKVIKKLRQMH